MGCRFYIISKPTVTLVLIILLAVNGCAPSPVKPVKICPGKESVIESLQALSSHAKQIKSFKANGQCFARLYDERSKVHKEEFTIKLWLNPPNEMRLFGDIAFNARGLDIGSNESEFWMGAKPKEIGNSFYWGSWDEQRDEGLLALSPKVLLEAFGIVNYDRQQGWSLAKEKGFDVLTKREGEGVLKKIHIYNCDYRVRTIEYFNGAEKAAVVLELQKYNEFSDGIVLPKQIKITTIGEEGEDDSFRIVLKSVRSYEFDEEKRLSFFGRPGEPKGFRHIYKIVDGKSVEQQ